MGHAEVLDQLLEGRRLFQRIEVLSMEVLDQRMFERRRVLDGAYDGRHRLEAGPLRRTPATLAGDQLVAIA